MKEDLRGESQNTEYKESWRDEYLKWICGFANAQGGRIYIGIADDRTVVGVDAKEAHKLTEDIPNKVRDVLGIVVDVNLQEQDGKDVIEIVVEPQSVPISYKGQYHYRSGSTKQELKGIALQQFVLKKMGKQWDDVYHESATITCIDEKAIQYFIRKGIKAQRLSEDSLGNSPRQVLENLHLISDEGKLKNAAILMFAKDPLKYFTAIQFKIGRFGKDEADLIFQDVIEGNILQMADRVLEVLKSKYLTSPIHYDGMQRKEPLEIPEMAFREILYNAIIHKQYGGAPIQMRVYTDRIELWNDGKLPEDYTVETLWQQHSSKPRNHNIADVFYKAGFIESWGRGFKKIREGFQNAEMPIPVYESHCGGVLVTIFRNVQSQLTELQMQNQNVESGQKVARKWPEDFTKDFIKELYPQLTERQAEILYIISSDCTITSQKISHELSQKNAVSPRTLIKDMNILQQQNLLHREGGKKNGIWKVTL